MDPTILAAVIGAFATLIAAALGVTLQMRSSSGGGTPSVVNINQAPAQRGTPGVVIPGVAAPPGGLHPMIISAMAAKGMDPLFGQWLLANGKRLKEAIQELGLEVPEEGPDLGARIQALVLPRLRAAAGIRS